MVATNWPTSNWPEGVPQDVTDYDKPLQTILDDTARDYPNQPFTIFSDVARTFSHVKDTSDRVANWLTGWQTSWPPVVLKRVIGLPFFCRTCPITRPYFLVFSKPVPFV